ncbi:MAG: Rap1a/Tai family immunity protein [Thalassobaculaceae bacterium]|tara:strand:+ start:573 stop:950 length:378 start_codon:yes stop_codon:yes gene_type:complete
MKFLNSLYFALYLFGFFVVPAQATEITARQLIASCSSPDSDEQAFCVGYIGGILDGAKTSKKNSGKIFFKHSDSGKTWCKTKEQNLIHATNDVIAFSQNSQRSHFNNALMLVVKALESKWPCKNL